MVLRDGVSAESAPPSPNSLLDELQRDKLSVIGHMASSIAHELSNPLATIVASAQAILAFWPHPWDAAAGVTKPPPGQYPVLSNDAVPLRQLREDLELILNEARRAGDIVHGLLASARQHPPEWRTISVADIVRRTASLCRHHLKLHNVVLQAPEFDAGESLPLWSRMHGDANQLQQVLLNLIINAQQAVTGYRGYGTVRVTLGPVAQGNILLSVEDDGPGVPTQLRDTIFQAFYTTKPDGQGTGLGLSISAEIVRAHGGRISVEERAEGGAIFRLLLPSLVARDATPLPSTGEAHTVSREMNSMLASDFAAEAAAHPAEGRRLLLVDDEPGIRRSVGRFLQRYGYRVNAVPTGRAAVTALRAGEYDAVISDLRMPGLSGEELFGMVRREFPEMASRIVFTSGDMMRPETQEFLRGSGCPSLQKPYELTDLVRVLNQLCPPPSPGDTKRATA
jgi:two-component system NtrC family sensor kinase